MFISRLRKKLEADPEVKIVNVHGKGYKLEALQTTVPITEKLKPVEKTEDSANDQ